jgi:hypothetical protein
MNQVTYQLLRTGTWAVWLNGIHWIACIREVREPSRATHSVVLLTEHLHKHFPTHVDAFSYVRELLEQPADQQQLPFDNLAPTQTLGMTP